MIVGDIKPVEEIVASISEYKNILLMGCGACVSVSLSGGDREAVMLATELGRKVHWGRKKPPRITTETIMRQCELDLIEAYHHVPKGPQAILSLACGAGVQTMADIYDPLPVIPALNTTFMGAATEAGIWREMCHGCGDCLLGDTGGICPVARCAKSLMNGPCGGTSGESCEINPEVPCAWYQIVMRLTQRKKLHLLHTVRTPKDWRPGGSAGPRVRKRTGVGGSPGE